MEENERDGSPSFDALFDAHYARLVRHLSVAAGSREVAEDALQEAFAQAHARWERVSAYEDPAGWIRRVAINRIRNHHRGLGRFLRAVDRFGRRRRPPVDELDRWADRADVARALTGLSSRQREAVSLYYLEGMPVASVAEAMGVSAGSVKTHLHRARQALVPLLEEVT